jgi:hypothetical protein
MAWNRHHWLFSKLASSTTHLNKKQLLALGLLEWPVYYRRGYFFLTEFEVDRFAEALSGPVAATFWLTFALQHGSNGFWNVAFANFQTFLKDVWTLAGAPRTESSSIVLLRHPRESHISHLAIEIFTPEGVQRIRGATNILEHLPDPGPEWILEPRDR